MRRYGWRPDLPDQRDHLFAQAHHPRLAVLPPKVSLRERIPPVFDQGQLGSCTANALLGAFGFIHPGFIGSRLQVYYDERQMEGTVSFDAGAEIRDGVKVLNQLGAAPESEWPYDIARFTAPPPARIMADAAAHKVVSYSRLTTEDDMRQCLAAGFPFVIGFTVYESFESGKVANSGVVPLPDLDEKVLGGHAVCVIGYDEHGPAGDCWEVRNSWGTGWGDHGNFWMPKAYFTHPELADDAWTLRA